jgi:hypothetical protein
MGDERRLHELQEEEARLRALQQSDDVEVRLNALRDDIRMAQAELDETIEGARDRARRLGGESGDQSSP